MIEKIRTTIQFFINDKIRDYSLKESDNFFKLGLVNSLFAMQLINFLEQEFQLSVSDEDLEIKNFNSINALTEFVVRKKSD